MGEDNKLLHHTFNTIARGFVGGGETSYGRKRYARQVMNIEYLSNKGGEGNYKMSEAENAFSMKNIVAIHPYNDDLMVITIRCDEWEIKRVLIYQGSSANILYWDAFERTRRYPDDLKPFKGSPVGFFREKVQVKGYITLNTTFREQE